MINGYARFGKQYGKGPRLLETGFAIGLRKGEDGKDVTPAILRLDGMFGLRNFHLAYAGQDGKQINLIRLPGLSVSEKRRGYRMVSLG